MPTRLKSNKTDIPAALAQFDFLPDSAHVRLPVVVAWRGSSPASVWRHVKAGILPKPVKLGPNTTAWLVGDLRAALAATQADDSVALRTASKAFPK